jgi:tetratricopeptide (TPR) repeat protein
LALLEKKCSKYLTLFPNDIEILNYYGRSLLLQKKFTECEIILNKILALKSNHLEANLNLARVYSNLDKFELSVNFYNNLLSLDKSYFAYFELGVLYFNNNKFREALLNLIEVVKIKPDFAETYFYLGLIYHKVRNYDLAYESFKQTIKFNPKHASAYNNLGLVCVELFKLDDAIFFYKKAIELQPDQRFFYTNLSQVYLAKGDFLNVRSYIDKALAIDPTDGEAHRILSVITNYKNENNHFEQMIKIFQSNLKENNSKMQLSFALAKAYEEKNDFKSATKVLILANKIRRKNFDFDISFEVKQFELLKKNFNKSFFQKHILSGFKSKQPIFIVGMPRSGTSLVEQIIASHPKVYGAGELSYLANVVNKYFKEIVPEDFFKAVNLSDSSIFTNIGKDYINSINLISNNSNYVTDKMPVNFRLIGFIKTALPNAKVVHCMRSSKDICLSIYKNFFGQEVMPWAYDQKELAIYYNNYVHLMDHWNETLPNYIYNIQYEDLISNQEYETKKLIDFCQLSWDDSCLKFYNNKRSVSTASVNQVRKNIYRSSINSWKNYENELADLFKFLD